MPAVSVVIPCHNQGRFLAAAVTSVLTQSFSDLELVVIDDGSSDETSAVMEQFSDPRILFLRQPRRGVAAARNRGIETTSGIYLNFLDADDYLAPDKIFRQAQLLGDRPDLDLAFCDIETVDEVGSVIDDYSVRSAFRPFCSDLLSILLAGGFMPPHTILIRRSAVNRAGLMNEAPELAGSEDYEFWLRVAATGAKACFVDCRDAIYRRHAGNASKDAARMRMSRREALIQVAGQFPTEVGSGLASLQETNRQLWEAVQFNRRLAEENAEEARQRVCQRESELRNVRAEHRSMFDTLQQVLAERAAAAEAADRFRNEAHQCLLELSRREAELEIGKLREVAAVRSELEAAEAQLHIEKNAHETEVACLLNESRANIQRLIQEAASTEADRIHLRDELRSVRDGLMAADARVGAAETRLEETERRFEQAGTRLAKAEARIADTEEHARKAEERAAKAKARVSEGDARIGELKTWADAQAAHIEILIEKERQLQAQLDHAHLASGFRRSIGHWARYALHEGIDLLQALMPESVRRAVRPAYLPVYRRLFPHGKYGPAARVEAKRAPEVPIPERPLPPTPALASRLPEAPANRSICPSFRPKISVVMPVWNHSRFLGDSIRSVLAQTYRELELILVDDGSDQDIAAVIAPFLEDSRLRFVRKQHSGIARTLSAGFTYAAGQFWTWTSADNLMHSRMLDTLLDYLLRNPSVDMVYADMDLIDENSRPLPDSDYRREAQDPMATNRLHLPKTVETLKLVSDNFIGACFLYRSELGRMLGPYSPRSIGTEDYDYWLRAAELGRVAHADCDEPLYSYRVHAETLSSRKREIPQNAVQLIEHHGTRRSFYAEPFEVTILRGLGSAEAARCAEPLAAAIRRMGYHVEIKTGSDSLGTRAEERNSLRKRIFLSLDPAARQSTWPSDSVGFQFAEPASLIASTGSEFAFVPPGRCWDPQFELYRKSRGNSYPLWDVPQLRSRVAVYCGPVRKGLFADDALRQTICACPDWQFLVVSTDTVPSGRPAWTNGRDNVIYLGHKQIDAQYAYLSRATVLVAPFSDSAPESLMQDVFLSYAHAGKPVLATTAVRRARLDDLPNLLTCPIEGFAGALDRCAGLVPDLRAADEYLDMHSAHCLAKRLVGIANNHLFEVRTGPSGGHSTSRDCTLELRNSVVHRNVTASAAQDISVLFEVDSLGIGGLERIVHDLACALKNSGFQVGIAANTAVGEIGEQCRRQGIDVELLSNDANRYRELLVRKNVQVLVTHYSFAGVTAAAELDIPVIDVIHNAYVWHGDSQDRRVREAKPFIAKYVGVSEFVCGYFAQRYGIEDSRMTCIPNGIDVDLHLRKLRATPRLTRVTLGIPEEDFVFLQVASFNAVKGQFHAVLALHKVVARIPNARLILLGPRTDRAYVATVDRAIEATGLRDRVLLVGPTNEPEDYYRLADAFLLPSITEGWSVAMTEAMFCGLPLILTRVGGAEQVIQDEDIGILAPAPYKDISAITEATLWEICTRTAPPNLAALADAMTRMAADRNEWKSRGLRGRNKVISLYDMRNAGQAYASLLRGVVARRAARAATA